MVLVSGIHTSIIIHMLRHHHRLPLLALWTMCDIKSPCVPLAGSGDAAYILGRAFRS
jgi:hypothetical protein